MFFKKKASQAYQQPTNISNNKESNQTSNPEEIIFNLDEVVNFCQSCEGKENEAIALKTLADCLCKGAHGIERNFAMAYDYYAKLAKIDEAAGIYGMGNADICRGLEEDDRFCFCVGVENVYKAYKLGNDEAKGMLESLAESGLFNNVSTFDDMIKFCANCYDAE